MTVESSPPPPRGTPANESATYELGHFPQDDIVHVVVVAIHWSVGDEIGLAVSTSIGIVSLLSVISLLVYLGRHILKTRSPHASERSKSVRRFLSTDMGISSSVYSSQISSLGFLANFKFLADYTTRIGGLCTFQGMMFGLGYASNGFFNGVVAVVTFVILVLQWRVPKWVMPVLVAVGATFAFLTAFLGPIIFAALFPLPFYGPNGVGCFVLFGAPTFQTWYILLPAFNILFLAIMIFCYVGIFLSIFGIISLKRNGNLAFTGSPDSTKWTACMGKTYDSPPRSQNRSAGSNSSTTANSRNEVTDAAKRMLWYPIACSVAFMPLAVAAFVGAATSTVPKQSLLNFCSCFGSSIGLLDVILFLFTRRALVRGSNELSSEGALPSTQHEVTTTQPSASGSKYELGDLDLGLPTLDHPFGEGSRSRANPSRAGLSELDGESMASHSELVETRSQDEGRR